MQVYLRLPMPGQPEIWKFALGLHCPESAISYQSAAARAVFLQLAPLGLPGPPGLWPGDRRGLEPGRAQRQPHPAHRCHQGHPSPAWKEIQDDLPAPRRGRGHSARHRLGKLTPAQRDWVLDGSPRWNGKWSRRGTASAAFLSIWRARSYKMHIRVLLSKYRSYTPCPCCRGARLGLESLLWRVGSKAASRCGAAARAALHAPRRNLEPRRSLKPCRACACTM